GGCGCWTSSTSRNWGMPCGEPLTGPTPMWPPGLKARAVKRGRLYQVSQQPSRRCQCAAASDAARQKLRFFGHSECRAAAALRSLARPRAVVILQALEHVLIRVERAQPLRLVDGLRNRDHLRVARRDDVAVARRAAEHLDLADRRALRN